MVNGVEVFLPLKGLIDVDKETARLTKELEKLDKEISRLAKKLGNEGFLAKAPADVVAGEKEKLAGYEEKKKSVEGRMQDLAKLK
jgi:valyl-tRNA synthetase